MRLTKYNMTDNGSLIHQIVLGGMGCNGSLTIPESKTKTNFSRKPNY